MLSFEFCYVCFVKVLDYGLLKATFSGLHRLFGNKRATLITTQKNEHETEMQARSHLNLSVNKDAARRLLPNKQDWTRLWLFSLRVQEFGALRRALSKQE
jgi:hypothetical protein